MRVLLVRAEGTPDADARALRDRGLDVTAEPFIEVAPCSDDTAPDRARALLAALQQPNAWLVLTSASAVRALVALAGIETVRAAVARATRSGACFAAVGPTSAQALAALGAGDVLVPNASHTASALLDLLRSHAPATAVLPRSSVGDALLPMSLGALGWTIIGEVVYETTPVAAPPEAAAGLRAGRFDALVLRSPSAARAVARLAGSVHVRTRVIAGGPTTALAAQRLGISVAAVARDSRAESIADAVVGT